jgi:hypothetical protein
VTDTALHDLSRISLSLDGDEIVVCHDWAALRLDRPFGMRTPVTGFTEHPAMALAEAVEHLFSIRCLIFGKTAVLSNNRLVEVFS